MKNLFLLAFVILLSCSNKEQNNISIEQTMSDDPISLALDNDTVKYMDIPLAFLMSKTSSKRVVLSSSTYTYVPAIIRVHHTLGILMGHYSSM